MANQVRRRKGKYNHVEYLDLAGNGILIECAIVKEDSLGNIYFIQLADLDNIDRGRMAKILTNRHAGSLPLWELMASMTLGNGVNALTYFNQLVKQLTPQGQVTKPRIGAFAI